jgi:hypothetical protein
LDGSSPIKGAKQLGSEEPEFINSDHLTHDGDPLLDGQPPKRVTIPQSSSSSSVDQDTIRSMLAEISD